MKPLPWKKVLVANRGEIALRVMRTLKRLGIRSVAVYSDADAGQRHVREADEAVRIGPAEARASYLSIEAVIGAAKLTGADAIHPGYGFLSENAAFARACEEAGITFVGPPAAVLEASADKLAVKRRVAKAGVPVIAGPLDPVAEDPKALAKAARATGYPLLLKAASGGGGKGMRTVRSEADLVAAAEGARREAGGAFGNAALYMERLIEGARHVEVQVLVDRSGQVAVLGERDCSIQRRHQKVIEESPAPGLSDAVRRSLHESGAEAARALGYRNAGTAELLLAPDGTFSFLEMNRRLQVEHAVTEACFGVDLVEWQLRIAAGESLPEGGAFVSHGHAVEARLYAEDPENGFLPSSGSVLALREPEGTGIRVDSALVAGMEVSPHYDPLLAKVIAHGETREEAIHRLDLALRDTAVLGVRTNASFLRAVLADSEFCAGRLSTDLLDRRGAALLALGPPPLEAILAAAADELLPQAGRSGAKGRAKAAARGPWHALKGFRLSESAS